MRDYYANDPRMMTARYAGRCMAKDCTETFAKGAEIVWYPKGKVTLFGNCATAAWREFISAAEDEYRNASMRGGW